jgi:phosphoadenosine phosphosulfate reductase
MLKDKINRSIKSIQDYELNALKLQNYGYHLAFSGGKDSQVIYELAKLAGVKFQAFFNKTTIDPPEILKFIREKYSDVKWVYPKKTMFQLIYLKGMLPLRQARYCCAELKETSGINSVVITGITNQESYKRSMRYEFERSWVKKENKYFLHPIKDWTVYDVFEFLKSRGVEWSELYKTQTRIGCIGCPMNPKGMRKDFKERPNFKLAYTNTVKKIMLEKGKYLDFDNADDVISWWSSGLSKAEYFANKKQYKIEFQTTN